MNVKEKGRGVYAICEYRDGPWPVGGKSGRRAEFRWSSLIRHLKLTFTAEKPPPCHLLSEVALMAAEENGEGSIPV